MGAPYIYIYDISRLRVNRTTLQVFVTYVTGALYEHPCRCTIVTDRHSWNVNTQIAFSLPFAAILVNCAPSGEMHNYCTPHIIKRKLRISWSISATTYSYLKCIVYDKLLKPRQSFLITLYLPSRITPGNVNISHSVFARGVTLSKQTAYDRVLTNVLTYSKQRESDMHDDKCLA